MSMVITAENFTVIRGEEHCEKRCHKRTDRRTDGRTEVFLGQLGRS